MARSLSANPHPDAMCRMPLFARCSPIGFQDLVDELSHRPDRRPRPLFGRQPHRDRTIDGLAHHTAVDAKLARHSRNTGYPELVLAAYLFEQIHRRSSPAHPTSNRPLLVGRVGRARTTGGPFPSINLGQSKISKLNTPTCGSSGSGKTEASCRFWMTSSARSQKLLDSSGTLTAVIARPARFRRTPTIFC